GTPRFPYTTLFRSSRGIADHEEQRSRQLRVDKDVEFAGAGAGTEMRDNPGEMIGRLVGRNLDEARLAVPHRDPRLAPHQPFRTTAADPAPELAVGGDQRLVAGLRRRRRLDPDDGRDDEGFAVPPQLRRAVQDIVRE